MIDLSNDIRLTDSLERELMAQAIEDQFRFRPLASLKNLWTRLAASFAGHKGAAPRMAQSAN